MTEAIGTARSTRRAAAPVAAGSTRRTATAAAAHTAARAVVGLAAGIPRGHALITASSPPIEALAVSALTRCHIGSALFATLAAVVRITLSVDAMAAAAHTTRSTHLVTPSAVLRIGAEIHASIAAVGFIRGTRFITLPDNDVAIRI